MGAGDSLERTLVAIAARCLRVAPQTIDPSAPLTRYGLDSLTALELTEALAAETGFELDETAFHDAPSIECLALRLLADVPASAGLLEARRVQRMLEDAQLEPAVDPRGLPVASAQAPVLLTGANGFLGGHALRELLAAGVREVICLVRAADDAAAGARLDAALAHYGVALAPGEARVRAVAADLAAPRFGLSAQRFAALAREAGAILHCAADVNWAAAYESLRGANVEATRALLRFATDTTAKPFHFVSSVAAGYSTRDPEPFDEVAAAADPAGLHLGYGQSKWVAERLVEAAQARGLPGAIYRPSLVAGDAGSGIGNDEDLLSRLLRGCVALGYAPDIDWPLDACPVGFVAAALARSLRAGSRSAAMHLRNPRPPCWTEAVLWMNLRGYAVRLEPYARWAQRVRCEAGPEHPLYALRGFLLQRQPEAGERYLAELYARPHVRPLAGVRSDAALASLGVRCPPLDADLLARYFERWIGLGLVRAPARTLSWSAATEADAAARVTTVLQRFFDDPSLRLGQFEARAFGADHSLIGELGAWRAGRAYRMQACDADVVRGNGERMRLRLAFKPKLADATLLEVTGEIAAACDPALGRAFEGYRGVSEFVGARARECAIYARADGKLRAGMPLWFGTAEGEPTALVLERVDDAVLAPGTFARAQWTPPHLEAALTGIAQIHAQWLGETSAIDRFGLRPLPQHETSASNVWHEALAHHAAAWLRSWLGGVGADAHGRLAAGYGAIARWIARQPCTLIHGDFNPRNLALRHTPLGPRLAVFDWELAGWGLPQRDIVELLCCVLEPQHAADAVERYLEIARLAMQRAVRRDVDPAAWHAGVRVALGQFGVTRLPLYFLAHRFRPQGFLERVARCWWQLASRLGTAP